MKERPAGRLPVRQLALAIALAYFILVGGTNLGTYVVPIAALNAVVAGALVALWIVELPLNNDLVDRLLLIALLAFLVTCMTSAFPRMSFEAATSVTAAAAGFGVGRGELVSGRAERAMITVLAICGSVLAAGFLGTWVPQWIEWWRVTATIPPLDLPLKPGPYRHYHLAAALLALLVPALLQMRQRKGLGIFAETAVIASLAAIYMSGSRTAWIALIAVGAGAVALRLRRRPRVMAGAIALVAGLGALALTGALGSTTSRLLNTLTLALRGETWSSGLGTWLERPLAGWGPGSFPAVFRFHQDLPVFPDPGGHAHNIVVQVLLEGGLVGLGALMVAVIALGIGISANRRRSPYALAGLALFGLMSIPDLPSNYPMVLVIGICWAALAAPRVSEARSQAPRRTWFVAASGTLGAVILVGVASTLIAWAAFDEAHAHLDDGDLSAARRALDRSVAFDPSMALYWRERGTRAAEAGDLHEAKGDLGRALQLNSGDTATLRALAVLTLHDSKDEAIALARRAAAMHGTQLDNQLTLAWVAREAGAEDLAERALADALTWYPWTAAAPTWRAVFEQGLDGPLSQGTAVWEAHGRAGSWEATWLRAMDGRDRLSNLGPSLAAIGAIMECDPSQAGALLGAAGAGADDQLGLTARLMLASLMDDQRAYRAAITVAILRGSQLANLAVRDPGPASPFSDYGQDVGLYRRIPMPLARVEPMLPTQGEGLAAWLQDPGGAARRSAPRSRLAECGG